MTVMKTMEMAMKKALAKQVADLKKPRIYDAKLVKMTIGEETFIFPKPVFVEVHGHIEIWLT